jgi:hypothetical protein
MQQSIEGEQNTEYPLRSILLQRYATIVDGKRSCIANVIENSVDLHALRVISTTRYQRYVQYLWNGWLVPSDDDPNRFVEYKHKTDTRFLSHVDPDRMRTPAYQSVVQILALIAYFGLYTGAISSADLTGDLGFVKGCCMFSLWDLSVPSSLKSGKRNDPILASDCLICFQVDCSSAFTR